MSYSVPDNFKGRTDYNVNGFSIPGLMPTETPVYDSQVFTSPDGSILFPMFSIDEEEDNPFPFPVAITTLDKKVLLYDVTGEHIVQDTGIDGRICFSLLIDGESKVLPVGQTFLEIFVNGISKKWVIVQNDTPFSKGARSGYRTYGNDRPLRFVVKNEYEIPEGTTTLFIPFEPMFYGSPTTVVAKALDEDGNNVVGLIVTSISQEGFNVDFGTPTTQDYTLEYIAWSLNSPLIISGLALGSGDFRIDDNIVLG